MSDAVDHCPHCSGSSFEILHLADPPDDVITCDVCGVHYGWDAESGKALLYAAAETAPLAARRR